MRTSFGKFKDTGDDTLMLHAIASTADENIKARSIPLRGKIAIKGALLQAARCGLRQCSIEIPVEYEAAVTAWLHSGWQRESLHQLVDLLNTN